MTTHPSIALMAAMPLPAFAAGVQPPDWVHLMPAGDVRTFDGRGPYRMLDVEAVIAASIEEGRGLPIDQDHATDLAAPKGGEAPARGWIVELASRDDGLWGRVEWTDAGRALVADRAYRGVSPVFTHDKAMRIGRLLRASLTNVPNLRGLTALHSEQDPEMNDMERIAEALGLPATATADEVVAKINAMATEDQPPALQAALAAIGTVLGVEADQEQIVVAAKAARAVGADTVTLQAQVTALTAERDGLQAGQARATSEAFVDGELAKGRAGLNASTRDDFVALHMSQPATAQRMIGAMPVLGAGAARREGQPPGGTVVALNAEQISVATALGISTEAFLATVKTRQAEAA